MEAKFHESINPKNLEISQLKDEISVLTGKIQTLESNMDDNDAYKLGDTIIIAGDGIPEISEGEICSIVVINQIKEKFNMEI